MTRLNRRLCDRNIEFERKIIRHSVKENVSIDMLMCYIRVEIFIYFLKLKISFVNNSKGFIKFANNNKASFHER